MKNGKILIAKRNLKKDQGGLWEFPGGKVEKGENDEQALKREIEEELDAEIEVEKYIGKTKFQYPEKEIELIFYKAKLLSDNIKLIEHEEYQWITADQVVQYEFAEADKIILKTLKNLN